MRFLPLLNIPFSYEQASGYDHVEDVCGEEKGRVSINDKFMFKNKPQRSDKKELCLNYMQTGRSIPSPVELPYAGMGVSRGMCGLSSR